MLEMKNFRENPEEILKDLKRRKLSDEVFKNVIKKDNRWRELIEEGNQIRAKRNSISKQIGKLKKEGKDISNLLTEMAGIKDKINSNEELTKNTLVERDNYRMRIPNILEKKVPLGNDEHDNKEIAVHGPEKNTTQVRSHQEIIEIIGGADLKRAAKVSGRRFYFLTGDLARLEMALVNYAIEILYQKGKLRAPNFLIDPSSIYVLVYQELRIRLKVCNGYELSKDFYACYIDESSVFLLRLLEHHQSVQFLSPILLKFHFLKAADFSSTYQ